MSVQSLLKTTNDNCKDLIDHQTQTFLTLEKSLQYVETIITLQHDHVVIFDIDGTVMTDGEVEPIMKHFVDHVRNSPAKFSYITAREKRYRAKTEKSIRRQNLGGHDSLIMMPSQNLRRSSFFTASSPHDIPGYKDSARMQFEKVIMTVGNEDYDHCYTCTFPPENYHVRWCHCGDAIHLMLKVPTNLIRYGLRKKRREKQLQFTRQHQC